MAYSEKAKKLRRCKAKKKDGTPCRAWAMWDNPDQLCSAHSGHTRGKDHRNTFYSCRTIPVCECEAYAFPHRPGGGLCRWPDPPIFRSSIKPGTRGFFHGLSKSLRGERTKRRVVYADSTQQICTSMHSHV